MQTQTQTQTQTQVSLPAAELDSFLSTADALQLSLLHNQPTANETQQEWQCPSTNEEDLNTEMKTIDKGIDTKRTGPQLAALLPNYISDTKTGLGKSSTLDKLIKSNQISRVQTDPTDVDDSEQVNQKAVCSECGREFGAFNHLWVHIQSVHHKRFRCKNCAKTYASAGVLNQHMDSAHNGVHLVCQDCGKKFSFQQSFDRHIKKEHFKSE